jgi:hypothetical protein
MNKYILKDKFSYPITFTLVWGILQFIFHKNDWIFLILSLSIMVLILSLVSYYKTDNYIQKILIENESINIQYQKNFFEGKPNIFSINTNSVKSYKFSSKSILDFSHSISIKFIDENNLYNKITFRTNNDDYFIDVIYLLKKQKVNYKNNTPKITNLKIES